MIFLSHNSAIHEYFSPLSSFFSLFDLATQLPDSSQEWNEPAKFFYYSSKGIVKNMQITTKIPDETKDSKVTWG